ncbi:hypothetical protein LTR72_009047 [Exophiala xenobiotica]|nr:hypothetical protein LTR72_009047 [Exophiala xenobiotica]KAK5288565.1 hypothetical protein LTR14_007915 [Exophiala xenobiotica]KAK5476829.1 hypothetical protein LTR55_008386 [Exophiala xenobiotica]
MASSNQPKLDSETISTITEKEKQLTGSDNPQKGGSTAQAQSHAGEPLNSDIISSITQGEKNIIGDRVKGGPTATVQSILTKSNQGNTMANPTRPLLPLTVSFMVTQSPTSAKLRKHTGEPINAQVLSDITKGETSISGKDQPLPGGPTAQAQHDLAKSRE